MKTRLIYVHKWINLGCCISTMLLMSLLIGCGSESKPARPVTVVDFGIAQSESPQWQLIWSDEFNHSARSPVNPQNWQHDIGGHGWGNQQLEYNTNALRNVAQNGDGYLEIVALKEEIDSNAYSSGRIHSRDLFEVQYGRIEAKIKLPIGQGIWPAFWMLGQGFPNVSWPDCGEIDIMEFRGQQPFESTGAVHGSGFSGGNALGGRFQSDQDLSQDFHLYAIEWSAQEIKWFVDEHLFYQLKPQDLPKNAAWPFQSPFFLLLNVAVGGHYVGSPNERTVFPQKMLVDYVRVYQAQDQSITSEDQ